MPSPEVKTGDADAHRQSNSGGSQQSATTQQTQKTDGGSEVEVEATGGGDPDGGDPGDDPTDQSYGDDDDSGGSIRGLLTNKKVIALLVVAGIILIYLSARGSDTGNGSLAGDSPQMQVSDPDQIGEAVDEATGDGGGANPYGEVPNSDADPLKADEFVLQSTDIFPSISGQGQDGNPDAEGAA